jgi:hypothetical protein
MTRTRVELTGRTLIQVGIVAAGKNVLALWSATPVRLSTPQGQTLTATGTSEIVDATTNTLYSMPACGAGR